MVNVLLVNKDPLIRNALSQALRLQLFNVTSLADRREIVKEIKRQKYDIIIMDIIISNKNGLETVKDIRMIDKDIPIIAVSGGNKTIPGINLRTAQTLGITDIIAKPFDSFSLARKIRHMLKN